MTKKKSVSPSKGIGDATHEYTKEISKKHPEYDTKMIMQIALAFTAGAVWQSRELQRQIKEDADKIGGE